MRICTLDGRGGVGDDRSRLCSSQSHWQPDFVLEMCYTMIEWQSQELAWILTAPKCQTKQQSLSLGRDPGCSHFTAFVLVVAHGVTLQQLGLWGNESTVPLQHQQAALACGSSGCYTEKRCTRVPYTCAWEKFIFHLHQHC